MSLGEKDEIANEVINKFKEVQKKKVTSDYRSRISSYTTMYTKKLV